MTSWPSLAYVWINTECHSVWNKHFRTIEDISGTKCTRIALLHMMKVSHCATEYSKALREFFWDSLEHSIIVLTPSTAVALQHCQRLQRAVCWSKACYIWRTDSCTFCAQDPDITAKAFSAAVRKNTAKTLQLLLNKLDLSPFETKVRPHVPVPREV